MSDSNLNSSTAKNKNIGGSLAGIGTKITDPKDSDSRTQIANPLINFRGLTLAEMSSKLSSIDSSSPPPDDMLNSSDFFNAQGELILSGLSEWSSDSDDEEIGTRDNGVVKSDGEVSDGSTASTESITAYLPSSSSVIKSTTETGGNIADIDLDHLTAKPVDGDRQEAVKIASTHSSSVNKKSKRKNKSVRFGHSNVDFGGEEVIQNLNPNSEFEPAAAKEYYWSEPEKDKNTESFRAVIHNVPNYGVRVYPGLQGLNVMNTSATSGWRILPGTENEQIMTRAPNFRTPGGYKPPLEEKPPRNLTSAEITEEVRKMYAEDAERDLDSQIIMTHHNRGDGDKQDSTLDEFAKRKPPVKRKLFKTDGNDDEPVANSVDPKSKSNEELVEKYFVKSHSYVCGEDETGIENVYGGGFLASPSHSDLHNRFTGDISRCLPRQNKDKMKGVNLNGSVQETKKSNLDALDKLWHDIQETKQHMEADMRNRMRAQDMHVTFEPTSGHSTNLDPFPKKTEVLVTNEKKEENQVLKRNTPIASKAQRYARRGGKLIHKGQSKSFAGKRRSPGQKRSPKSDISSDLFDLDSLELSSILQEAQIQESDLDDILNEISEFPIPGQLFDESEAPVELTSALQQLQITDWAKAGANEYVNKFHEEKYKRQQCEKEILQVQKELLDQRERIAVLEGLLQSKEATVTKHKNLWDALVKKWKTHEMKCKKTITELQSEQIEAKSELEARKVRLSEYEFEMGKAVLLIEEFKLKNEELQKEMCDNKTAATLQKAELENQVEELKIELTDGNAKKEAMMRALRESQTKLDENKSSLDIANKKVVDVEEQAYSAVQVAEQMSSQNSRLREYVSELENSKMKLESELKDITENFKSEKAEQELYRATTNSRLEARLKEQGEKLHEYYNGRMQEILKVQSEKMHAAEKELIKINERKISDLEQTADAKILEVESKFQTDYETLKKKYESEIVDLRRENLEKGKLIGAVSRQLQSFESGNGVPTDLPKIELSKSTVTAPAKSRSHGCNKPSKANSIKTVQTQSQIQGLEYPNTPVITAPASTPPLSNIILDSVDMQNCITTLVNAYKEKKPKAN